VAAIAGGVVGGVGGFALLAFAIWWFGFRPEKLGKSKKGREAWYTDDTINEGKGPAGAFASSDSDIALPQVPASLARRPTGTYNLQNVDFRPESLDDQIIQEQKQLPAYEEATQGRGSTSRALT